MSLALEICRITEEHVGTEHLGDVRTVVLEVGDDAGVEVGNLEFCLEALLSSPPFGEAKPVIEPAVGDVFRVKYLEVET
jgi:Zn finger protein HypA/HybF involved in hydrogenase expression